MGATSGHGPRVAAVLAVAAAVAVATLAGCTGGGEDIFTSKAVVSSDSKTCLDCHTKKQPSIVAQWQASPHAEKGVGCYECHQADPSDPDVMDHFGYSVAVLVTPKDCGRCHGQEAEEFTGSYHAKAGEILGSLDNYLGEVVEGLGATVSGCKQCHGSIVEVQPADASGGGRLTAETWPNFGIGRVNPDGSVGACSACHSRHDFTVAQARSPETCSRCHLGPDHPQKEVYESSKHFIAFTSHLDEMNLDSESWVVGRDYTAAPTCATCHLSATASQPSSHDPGRRISWNLRAEVSFRMKDAERKRQAMKDVCLTCHNPAYVDAFYTQFDAGVELYNTKFAEPARDIVKSLRDAGKVDPVPFNEEVEWLSYYLWHHDGRRARTGLAMMGPDYVQWHGFYDVAERFYIELVPLAERLKPGVARAILQRPEHQWYRGGLSAEDRAAMDEFYRRSYERGE